MFNIDFEEMFIQIRFAVLGLFGSFAFLSVAIGIYHGF